MEGRLLLPKGKEAENFYPAAIVGGSWLRCWPDKSAARLGWRKKGPAPGETRGHIPASL
jgi:hypothetical protein